MSAEARSAAAALQHSFPSVGRCMTGVPAVAGVSPPHRCVPHALTKARNVGLGPKPVTGRAAREAGRGRIAVVSGSDGCGARPGAAWCAAPQRVPPVPGRRKPRRHRRSTRSCREYQLIKDSCYKLNRHVACARQKFRPLPHFGRRLCNANHLRFRRYPKVRLDHLPCRSSAYVSPVRAQWGADYFGLRPIDFIHRQSGRR